MDFETVQGLAVTQPWLLSTVSE